MTFETLAKIKARSDLVQQILDNGEDCRAGDLDRLIQDIAALVENAEQFITYKYEAEGHILELTKETALAVQSVLKILKEENTDLKKELEESEQAQLEFQSQNQKYKAALEKIATYDDDWGCKKLTYSEEARIAQEALK